MKFLIPILGTIERRMIEKITRQLTTKKIDEIFWKSCDVSDCIDNNICIHVEVELSNEIAEGLTNAK